MRIPDYVPDHLREFYEPPGPEDHAFFEKTAFEHWPRDMFGRPSGLPTVVNVYKISQEWAEQRIGNDPRWQSYLSHKNEPSPDMPDWLRDAPITPRLRGVLYAAMQSDYEERHRPDRPHQDENAYLAALYDQCVEMTAEDVRRLWDERIGIPRAAYHHRLAQAEQAAVQ